MSTVIEYRRSAHIVCFWRQDHNFVFYNYATNQYAGATGLTCDVLTFFTEWQTLASFVEANSDTDVAVLEELLQHLVDATLLMRSDVPRSADEAAMTALDPWNPEAGFFHARTRNVEFFDSATAAIEAARRAAVRPRPAPVKRYPGASLIPLLAPAPDREIEHVLLSRRTWRRFGSDPVPLAALSRTLAFSAGVQTWLTVDHEGDVPLKTSPSGGARHPVELYLLACKVEGLDPGLYHYASDAHGLELIGESRGSHDIPRYFPQCEWYQHCGAVVFFTAVYTRDLWRYQYSRAYRAPLVEAGHVCQSFLLLATAYELAPFCLMALADSEIERDLGIDGVSEAVLYAAGVGTRPAGQSAAIAPPGFVSPEMRSNSTFRGRNG